MYSIHKSIGMLEMHLIDVANGIVSIHVVGNVVWIGQYFCRFTV